jgi:hypothetical protein
VHFGIGRKKRWIAITEGVGENARRCPRSSRVTGRPSGT